MQMITVALPRAFLGMCALYARHSYTTVHAFPDREGSHGFPVVWDVLGENVPSAGASPLCVESQEHCNSRHTWRQ
jgi:hypothetical protein